MSNSNQKQAILGRVREALKQKTDPHVRERSTQSGHNLPVIDSSPGNGTSAGQFLPPTGANFDERVALFAELSERLQTDFSVVDSIEQAGILVRELAELYQWKRIGYHSNEQVESVLEGLDVERLTTDQPYDASELEQCDAGITACDALIAQTASVLITAKSAGGRALSVLPPHHVVIATADQMLGSMVDGYRLLQEKFAANNWPSFTSFITGPSRTADVERVLVLGAHGPKKLTVLLVRR